jgi:hypothetical protein
MKKLLKLLILSSVVVGFSGCKPQSSSSSISTSSKISSSEKDTPISSSTIENTVSEYAYDIPENPNVFIHYYNYSESYNDWLTWIWPHEPTSLSGARFYFQKFDGTPDLDGTIYALPQRKDNDGEKVWYITEVSLD